jgi:hypothetical protein
MLRCRTVFYFLCTCPSAHIENRRSVLSLTVRIWTNFNRFCQYDATVTSYWCGQGALACRLPCVISLFFIAFFHTWNFLLLIYRPPAFCLFSSSRLSDNESSPSTPCRLLGECRYTSTHSLTGAGQVVSFMSLVGIEPRAHSPLGQYTDYVVPARGVILLSFYLLHFWSSSLAVEHSNWESVKTYLKLSVGFCHLFGFVCVWMLINVLILLLQSVKCMLCLWWVTDTF